MPAGHVATNHDPEPVRLEEPDLHYRTPVPRRGPRSHLWDAFFNTLPVSESHG
jgi:hypothetical protein